MRALVIGNWKMNPKSFKEARKLLEATKKVAGSARGISVVVAPPSIYMRELTGGRRAGKIAFAAQHAHFDAEGAHTGDISMTQAKDAGASYVLIGHAERRTLGESNEDTRKKVAVALSLGLIPVLCVGESKRGNGGEHFDVVRSQLRAGFGDVPASKASKVLVVYEPLWTIGKDTAMHPRDMHEMEIFIRKTLLELYIVPQENAPNVKVLYGGSVDATNAGAMLDEGQVKGFLVGRASIDAESFGALLKTIASL